MWTRRSGGLTVMIVATVSLSAIAANVVTVSQKGRAFGISDLQLRSGGTLNFSNEDKFIHQIYVDSPGFSYESNEQMPGTNVEVTFPKTGTFEVRCHIHPKMLLRVDVR